MLTTVGLMCCQPSRNLYAGGYLRAADVSSFCTPVDEVIVQRIYCTNTGRILLANSEVPQFVYPTCLL
jgi:hypothetical protein